MCKGRITASSSFSCWKSEMNQNGWWGVVGNQLLMLQNLSQQLKFVFSGGSKLYSPLWQTGNPLEGKSSVAAQRHSQHIKAVKRLRASQGFHPAI